MRRGFGIIYAIVILVLIATIGIYTLELSSRSAKSVSDEHIKIQMQFYMNSAVEYALLWLSENPSRSNPGDFGGADPWSDLNISYGNRYNFQLRMYETHLDVPESNGSVMLDIVGRFNDTGFDPIVVSKRLILKP